MPQDPAFLWETAALRGPAQPAAYGVERPAPAPPGPVESSPEPAPRRDEGVRWVTLQEAEEITGLAATLVRNWARKGRIPSQVTDGPDGPVRLVPLGAVLDRAHALGRHVREDAETAASGPAPPGTLLVPIDAWEKMLAQMGNLHEAGQQLADARERAAKAETEATFLRERLGELRTELVEAKRQRAPEPPAPAPEPEPETEPMWRAVARAWRARRR